MKYVCLLSLITLLSCSTTPVLRGPASNTGGSCDQLMGSFIGKSKNENKEDLLNNKVIRQEDLKFLDSHLFADSLSDQGADRESVEVSYLLIKKKFPHFDEEQVLGHYQLLKTYCGI